MRRFTLVAALFLAFAPGARAEHASVYSHFLNALLLERNGELERALSEYNRSLELEPKASYVLHQRAGLYMKMGNPERALADTQAYVKAHPDDAESLRLLASIFLVKGRNEAARLSLEKVLKLDPKDSQTHIDLAVLLMEDDPKESIKHLERFNVLEPQSVEGYYHLGIAYQKLSQPAAAKKMFEKVIQMDPDSLPSLFLLGQMNEREGRVGEAVKYYEQALERIPDNSSLRMQLVQLYAQKSDLAGIERLLEYFKNDPQAPVEANLWLGVVSEGKKDWNRALQYYLKAQTQADNPEIHIRLASIYSHLGKAKETLKSLNALIEKNPENPQFRYFLGLAYLDLKKPAKAVGELRKAVALKKDFSSAFFQLGVAYDQMGDWDKSEGSFRAAIAVDTMNASAYNYLGYTYADRNLKLFEARKLIERALELDQDNPAYIDSLGWLNFREGNYKAALRHLQAASEIAADPSVLDHLGDCQSAMGDISDAALSFSKSLELEPDNGKVRKKLEGLNRFLVPTSPARKILKAFEFRLRQATHISGPFFLKGNFGMMSGNFSQGFFYLRREDPVFENSTANVLTEIRVDLMNQPLAPSLTLRYRNLPDALRVFPPEFKARVPQEIRAAFETVASFLNGKFLSEMDGPETRVEEKGKEFVLTRGDRKMFLDKKAGTVSGLEVPDLKITIDHYKTIGEIRVPENLRFALVTRENSKAVQRKFEINFSALSLEKIESKVFEIGNITKE